MDKFKELTRSMEVQSGAKQNVKELVVNFTNKSALQTSLQGLVSSRYVFIRYTVCIYTVHPDIDIYYDVVCIS